MITLPTGFKWRELWEAQHISGTNWPSSIAGGNAMTLQNSAAKRTTTDGVHFIAGVNTSNVKFADPYDAVNDWWAVIEFTPNKAFSSASSTDQYLAAKYVDGTNYLIVFLRASDGKLVMDHTEASAQEIIVSTETSWVAGTRYVVLVSISTTNGKRLIVNGGTAVTEGTDQTAISLAADVTIGARDDGTSTEGFAGVIHRVVMGNDALTTTANTGEEALLAKGVPPSDAVNLFTFDEGRGVTANDRGSGADNGTLDSSCDWAFTIKAAVMSVDGINDYASTGSVIDISGSTTVIWVIRAKTTFSLLGTSGQGRFLNFKVGNDYIESWYREATDDIKYQVTGGGTASTAEYTGKPSIDDFLIFIGTFAVSDKIARLYVNGVAATPGTAGDNPPGGALAAGAIGATTAPASYGVSPYLFFGIIGGALSAQQVLDLSIDINEQRGLGLTI